MKPEEFRITKTQLETKCVGDRRRLCMALLDILQETTEDQTADYIVDLLHLVERSLLAQPATDLEALATKALIVCPPNFSSGGEQAALMQDVARILNIDI